MRLTIKIWQLIILVMLPLLYLTSQIIYAATAGNLGASLSLESRPPQIYFVSQGRSLTPVESSTNQITIEVRINDPDYVADIDDTKVNMTLYRSGETNRTDTLCTDVGAINTTAENYTCDMNMFYYDTTGTWTIYAYAMDMSGNQVVNNTVTMTYNSLEAWNMTPSTISFGSNLHMGDLNTQATDDPVVIYNSGNAVLTGAMEIKGQQLKGATTSTQVIPAVNFTVNVADACDGTVFVNNTDVSISGFTLANGATASEQIYFCLEQVPAAGLTAQTYTTSGWTAWNLNSD